MEKKQVIHVDYDRECDILYVTLQASPRSIGREFDSGVWVFYDKKDRSITGVNVFEFSKKLSDGSIQNLSIPFELDFYADVIPKILTLQSFAS